jgi:hypothetical protein
MHSPLFAHFPQKLGALSHAPSPVRKDRIPAPVNQHFIDQKSLHADFGGN